MLHSPLSAHNMSSLVRYFSNCLYFDYTLVHVRSQLKLSSVCYLKYLANNTRDMISYSGYTGVYNAGRDFSFARVVLPATMKNRGQTACCAWGSPHFSLIESCGDEVATGQ